MGFDQQEEERDEVKSLEAPPRWLLCAACRARIVREDARIERGGRHEHTRTNPANMTFTIGCFSPAPGAGAVGAPEPRWTWFPTHAWQVALCSACHAHLGWRYVSIASGDDPFDGLILDHLAAEAD